MCASVRLRARPATTKRVSRARLPHARCSGVCQSTVAEFRHARVGEPACTLGPDSRPCFRGPSVCVCSAHCPEDLFAVCYTDCKRPEYGLQPGLTDYKVDGVLTSLSNVWTCVHVTNARGKHTQCNVIAHRANVTRPTKTQTVSKRSPQKKDQENIGYEQWSDSYAESRIESLISRPRLARRDDAKASHVKVNIPATRIVLAGESFETPAIACVCPANCCGYRWCTATRTHGNTR